MKNLYYLAVGGTVVGVFLIILASILGPIVLFAATSNPAWLWLYSPHILLIVRNIGRFVDQNVNQ